jgi:hypothetical protein
MLDTRIINGERCLLFGPYAGFSTKFLKNGSYPDLFLSVELHNVWPMLSAGVRNLGLTKYLISQGDAGPGRPVCLSPAVFPSQYPVGRLDEPALGYDPDLRPVADPRRRPLAPDPGPDDCGAGAGGVSPGVFAFDVYAFICVRHLEGRRRGAGCAAPSE